MSEEVKTMQEISEEKLEEVSGAGYWDSFPYQIQPGDTLWALSQRFHTTIAHIMALNPKIVDPSKIIAWDWINMPYPDY